MAELGALCLERRGERLVDDEDARSTVVDQECLVSRREERRERHGHGPDLDRAEERSDEVRRVREDERDALFGLDAERPERVPGPVHPARDRGV